MREKKKEDCSSGEPTSNLVSKGNNDVSEDEYDNKTTFVMSHGVLDSKEHMLKEVLNTRRFFSFFEKD